MGELALFEAISNQIKNLDALLKIKPISYSGSIRDIVTKFQMGGAEVFKLFSFLTIMGASA